MILFGKESGATEQTNEIIVEEGAARTHKEFHDTYLVLSDNLSQTGDDVLLCPGLPVIGSLLRGCVLKKADPKERDTVSNPLTGTRCILWEIRLDYDSEVKPTSDTTPEVSWSAEVEKEVFDRDVVTGQRIATTAGEPIHSETDMILPILEITRIESYPFDPNMILRYAGKGNSATFYGAPAGCVYCFPMEVSEEQQAGVKVCRVGYKFKFKLRYDCYGNFIPYTWRSQLLNQGYMYRRTATSKAEIYKDKTGNPIKVNLGLDGTVLNDSNGANLVVQTVDATTGFAYVYSGPGTPVPISSDIGSLIVVDATSPVAYTPGEYLVVGIDTKGGHVCWVLQTAPAIAGSTFGIWTLLRAAIYLAFNRMAYIDHNALNMGPY